MSARAGYTSPHSKRVASPDTLKINEIFASLQGEGPSLGSPSLFVRLALCNLRCEWCDTRYTWDFERYDPAKEIHSTPVQEVAARIRQAPEDRVVITGGEPLLQQAALSRLLELIPADKQVEVETNGTISPEAGVAARVNQWNVSPKLAHAGDALSKRIRPEVLRALLDTGRAFLKFVVRGASDLVEVRALLEPLQWPNERVFLMPEATTPELHAERAEVLAALCREHGYRFTPRLHVLLWGGERAR
ncbi:MAG: 7-carboxy-7-deazaguanine synthase QueE [Myxococcota bacterium]